MQLTRATVRSHSRVQVSPCPLFKYDKIGEAFRESFRRYASTGLCVLDLIMSQILSDRQSFSGTLRRQANCFVGVMQRLQ